ncbi:MAG: response regulator receiver modulated CheB methylesterase [Polyangiaceae bacterium]|jgi:two-component system chemotaxis response regulator CheB|nr:response regulator receiver modulated CheB methylesterase [Polyangiaceae bacterium]
MSTKRLRVLVVEDSPTVRRRLCDALSRDPGIEIIGEAGDGQRAIELCQAQRPDVMTLDMILPIMTGLSATEYIMAHCPTPILIVSASTNRGELFKTYDALAAGAVDVLEKPRGDDSDEGWDERFIAAVRLVSKIKVITHPRARLGLSRGGNGPPIPPAIRAPSSVPPPSLAGDLPISIVALGASTGGPSALVRVLRDLPRALPLTILLVLHIDEPFGSAFAEWLSDQTPHAVRFAVGGEPLESKASRVLMAQPGRHLVVDGQRLHLTDEAERHSCRPSIDVLFESLARSAGPRSAAALLTGMGRDGASGLLALRVAGALTVAQNEESSVVYGMPREAALIGAARHVLPLTEIGSFLSASVTSRGLRRV